MKLIHFMHNPPVTEHPNQWAIVEKGFYVSVDYWYMLLSRQKSGDSV